MLMVVASCASDDGRTLRAPRPDQGESVAPATTPPAQDFAVTGTWSDGGAIDARYTCAGANVSPPLSWTPGPEGTVTYAVTIDDLDEPDTRHWVIANIDAATLAIAEGTTPEGAVVAAVDDGTARYDGPCPTEGESNDYVVTLYAVSQVLEAQPGDDPTTLRAAIEAATLAEASTEFTAAG